MSKLPVSRIRSTAGFTLIELMVTIVVATILVAIAVPAYTSQIRKSRRTEARTALLDLASREERFNSTNSAYTSSLANLGYAGTAWPVKVGSGYYQVTAVVCAAVTCGADTGTGAAFLLTAQPVAPQDKDTICASFTLDNTGSQQVTGTASGTPSSCWN
jgi:type IV pilus assembly protein PilE